MESRTAGVNFYMWMQAHEHDQKDYLLLASLQKFSPRKSSDAIIFVISEWKRCFFIKYHWRKLIQPYIQKALTNNKHCSPSMKFKKNPWIEKGYSEQVLKSLVAWKLAIILVTQKVCSLHSRRKYITKSINRQNYVITGGIPTIFAWAVPSWGKEKLIWKDILCLQRRNCLHACHLTAESLSESMSAASISKTSQKTLILS